MEIGRASDSALVAELLGRIDGNTAWLEGFANRSGAFRDGRVEIDAFDELGNGCGVSLLASNEQIGLGIYQTDRASMWAGANEHLVVDQDGRSAFLQIADGEHRRAADWGTKTVTIGAGSSFGTSSIVHHLGRVPQAAFATANWGEFFAQQFEARAYNKAAGTLDLVVQSSGTAGAALGIEVSWLVLG